jgi:uncharacterized protein (DUF1697 family)
MSTRILLLRGINVGGNRILPMKDLKELLLSMGLRNVKTYIQSGNVVFDDPDEHGAKLGDEIGTLIEGQFGFRPHSLLLGADDLREAAEANPFPEAEAAPQRLHLFFLGAVPDEPDVEKLESVKSPSERFALTDHAFYLHAPDGIGRSKLAANVERILGVPATARNWRTVMKLLEMIRS